MLLEVMKNTNGMCNKQFVGNSARMFKMCKECNCVALALIGVAASV